MSQVWRIPGWLKSSCMQLVSLYIILAFQIQLSHDFSSCNGFCTSSWSGWWKYTLYMCRGSEPIPICCSDVMDWMSIGRALPLVIDYVSPIHFCNDSDVTNSSSNRLSVSVWQFETMFVSISLSFHDCINQDCKITRIFRCWESV